jgi:hypothetical protein
MLSAILNYVVGRLPSSSVSHYEVADVLHGMCGQNAVCQLSDTLDLVIAVATYSDTAEGRAALDNLQRFLGNPALQPFLTNDAQQYGGEEGVVALTRLVLDIVQAMDDPSDLDSLPIDAFPEALRADVRQAISDLKLLLDPRREPNVLRAIKKVNTCFTTSDPELHAVRMFYRLWFEAKLPDFSFLNFVTVAVSLRDTDERGTLLHLSRTLAEAVREDEAGMDAAAEVCRLLSTRANAERAMPVVATLFESGVVGEAICALDTLVYGCAGGTQPACEAQRQ